MQINKELFSNFMSVNSTIKLDGYNLFFDMSQDIMACLIYSQSKEMDVELGSLCPDVFPLPSIQVPTAVLPSNGLPSKEHSLDKCSSFRSNESKEDASQQYWDHQQLSTFQDNSNHKASSKIDFKNKNISKRPYKSSKQVIDSDQNRPSKRKGYPTNNLLPNFKGPHLQFLEKHLGKNTLAKNPLISHLISKNGISMAEYQRLYTTPEYDEAFKLMFKSKILYRTLLLSRCNKAQKIIFQRKIYVFEQAFRNKIFERIN